MGPCAPMHGFSMAYGGLQWPGHARMRQPRWLRRWRRAAGAKLAKQFDGEVQREWSKEAAGLVGPEEKLEQRNGVAMELGGGGHG